MLLINKDLYFDQTKWYSTQKKRLFQMASFKFHEKKIIEKVQIDKFKDNPLKGEPCTLYIL